MFGSLRLMLSIFFSHSLSYIFEPGSLTISGAHKLARLAGLKTWGSVSHCLPSAGIPDTYCHTRVLHGRQRYECRFLCVVASTWHIGHLCSTCSDFWDMWYLRVDAWYPTPHKPTFWEWSCSWLKYSRHWWREHALLSGHGWEPDGRVSEMTKGVRGCARSQLIR